MYSVLKTEMHSYALLLLLILVASSNAESLYTYQQNVIIDYKNTSVCPPWFLYDNTTERCTCGDDLGGIVSCDSQERSVYLISCYCMTYDQQFGTTVGNCFTNCVLRKANVSFQTYLKIPSDGSYLNVAMCGERWNRTGRLCGACKPRHYPLVYSYEMKCIECEHAGVKNWLKFVTSAFLPLTIFFILVLGLGISATSPKLEAFILYSQIITTPANVRILLEVLDSGNYSTSQTLCRILASLYAVWNLDFFRTLLPNNCLKISTLQLLALDYIIAVYPIVLIVVTYIVVDLYDRELFPLVWFTNKFKHYAKFAGSTINLKSSILTAFSTFLILSYGKFLTVSFDLLDFTKVYTPDGKAIGNVLYYDASIEYFGKEHLPYGILAIAVTILFNILPLLFTLLHPLRCFKGHLGKWPALRICLDTFQGCYKDGTAGTRDCRFFSSLLFLIRIVLFVTYGFVKNTDFYRIASVLLLVLVLLISLFKPFKPQFATYNTVHVSMILNLAVWYILISSISLRTLESFSIVILYDVVCVTVAFMPLIYVTVLILKWFMSLTFFRRHCLKYFVCCHKRITGNSLSGTQDTDVDESFPHRLEHVSEEHPFRIAAINVPSYGSAEHRGDNTY